MDRRMNDDGSVDDRRISVVYLSIIQSQGTVSLLYKLSNHLSASRHIKHKGAMES